VTGWVVPACASAHGFGRLYNLPVPFWLYAWGAASALVLSFLLAGYFAVAPASTPEAASRDIGDARWVRALRRARPALQALGVFLLLLCIATALIGNRDPFRNFSMTFFWVVFLLGFTYLTALVGNFYASLNPWRVMTQLIGRFARGYARGRVTYPERLGDWPALALYLGFTWFELFNHGRPSTLGAMLLGYSVLNVVGVGVVGSEAWFRHCEFFSVLLRLVALMAPLDYRPAEAPDAHGTLRLRSPLAGLVQERPERISTVAFALAMLSTTAFDGLRATQWWVVQFWGDAHGVGRLLSDVRPVFAYAALRPWYIAWETYWLLLSPFLYLAAYVCALALAKRVTRSPRRLRLRELALDFGYTLLPIALAYNVTHYATLILGQGMKIVSLASDPFGWGWNLFGTAMLLRAPILPGMGLVWHTQVVLILLGHIASVFAAHRVALRLWPERRVALRSQVPLLGLMVFLTVAGLWILAQPLTAMLMR
jgi:hypothetical protein